MPRWRCRLDSLAVDDTPDLALLRLLAGGATAEQLRGVLAGSQATDLALRTHHRLDEQRRKELELRALLDTARDLAAARDPDEILDEIVRRARSLLGTDLAYLTLYDPLHGDTYMRATDGAVAASFRCLRLELGVGLGGAVAATHEAWWTADYWNDHRFSHTPTIDAGVSDEGIVAICGTPLIVENEFVGVLFASERSTRTFAPDAVALLGSLATIAALTIIQTRARRATEAALAELSRVHEAVRTYTADVEHSAEAHDRFTQLVVAGGGVDDVTQALGATLGGWIVVIDADGLRRSSFGPVPGDDVATGEPDPLAQAAVVVKARVHDGRIAEGGTYALAVRARRELFAILVGGGRDLSPLDWRIVERASAVAALVFLFERGTADARRRAISEQVSDLVAGTLADVEAHRLLRQEGVDPRGPFCLIGIRASRLPSRRLVIPLATALAGVGLAGEHARHAVAIVPGDDPGRAAKNLVARISRVDELTAAGVGPLMGTHVLPDAFADAVRGVQAMIAFGRRGQGAATGDLGFAGLVVGSTPDVAAYIDSVLGVLLAYDQRKGTRLVETVDAYFAAAQSPLHAASALHVHPNTVSQRLERVNALLGANWASPDHALEIQLALRLRRLLPDQDDGIAT